MFTALHSDFADVTTGVEFRFGLRESKLILKFQLLHISMEKLILISGCYENHCENRFSDSRRISSPVTMIVTNLVKMYVSINAHRYKVASLHFLSKTKFA